MNKAKVKDFVRNNAVIVLLVVIFVILSVMSEYFLQLGNIMDLLKQASINGIIAMGMAFVITTGGIDLSVGAVWAISGVIIAECMVAGVPWPIACVIGIAVGIACGFCTGLLVTKGGVQPFIATLATMNVFRGIALVMTKGYTVYNLPEDFRIIGGGMLFGIIPSPVIAFAIVFVVSWFIFTKQVTGRHLLAIGNNKEAARLSGINVEKLTMYAYIFSGIMCAIGGGIVATSRLGAAEPTIGNGGELDAIAAVVIGGTSMSGGETKIVGTLFGALLLSAINNGLTLLNVSTFWKTIAIGLILIVAMLMDSLSRRGKR